MEHLKTYENWLKKAWNKMLEPKETKEYPADFNNDEEIKLKELLFKKKECW